MMDAVPAIDWVRMVLPNLHHWTIDLAPFGLDNPGQVFVSTRTRMRAIASRRTTTA